MTKTRWTWWLPLAACLWIAGCGGGGGPAEPTPPGSPVIALQPADTTVDDGASATFSVGASGDATIGYQWQRNGIAIAGATGATLTLQAGYADNGARFRAVASNGRGQATSNDALLTVRPLAPTLVQQPQPATAAAGATQTFSVQVSGGTQPVTYQWQRNGVNIAGATGASYTTPALASGDNGASYRVLVSNPAGTLTSNAAALTVGTAFGALTFSGAGAPDIGAGSGYGPVTASAGGVGPTCTPFAGSTLCNSTFTLRWSRGPGDQLLVQMLSTDIAGPGAAPGTAINGVAVTLATGVFGSYGLQIVCIAGSTGCDFPALNIVLDTAARTLTFNNTTVPSIGPGNLPIVINGTLRY